MQASAARQKTLSDQAVLDTWRVLAARLRAPPAAAPPDPVTISPEKRDLCFCWITGKSAYPTIAAGCDTAPMATRRAARLLSASVARKRQRPETSKYTRLGLDSTPRAHLRRGHAWPDGELERGAPAEARLVQQIVVRLEKVMSDNGGLAISAVAEMSGVNKSSISVLLRGETWGTLPVIARLERILDVELWGQEHRNSPTPQGSAASSGT